LNTDELKALSTEQLLVLEMRMKWLAVARRKQLPPKTNWTSWGLMSGRGFGKTRTAANFVADEALSRPKIFVHVLAPTRDDVQYTCFEGETGLLSVIPPRLILQYNRSDLILYLTNGTIIRGFSTENPDKLRGPQCHLVWAEELSSWAYPDEAWSMMQLGLRLGDHTKLVWTTTPKPLPIMKARINEEDETHIIVRGTTYENRANLAKNFYDEIAKYEGTRLGRQEIYGELIDPEEAGIVKRSQWRLWPAKKALPPFESILLSLDTAFTEKTFDTKKKEPDKTAGSVWGIFYYDRVKHAMLLDAWADWFGFPELVEQVRKAKAVSYGVIDMPMFGKPYIPAKWNEGPIAKGRSIDVILIEDKGSGISLRQTLAREGILATPYNPGRADKLARLHRCTPMFAHGRVWAVESNNRPGQFRNWAEPFIETVCTFHGEGTVEFDDPVDSVTQALNYLMDVSIRTFEKPVDRDLRKEVDLEKYEQVRRRRENPYS